MANRVIRDWTASEAVQELSAEAEVFFTRLIMKADDYGNYTGNPKLINAALFPLKDYKVKQIESWINECRVNGLIVPYSNSNKDYIHIPNFGQTLRRMKAVFPSPTDDGSLRTTSDILRTSDGQVTAERKGKETEEEIETKAPLRVVGESFSFADEVDTAWQDWLMYKKEKKQKLTPSTEKKQIEFLGGRAGPEIIAIINQSISNGWTGLFELKQNGTTKAQQESIARKQAFQQRVNARNSGKQI